MPASSSAPERPNGPFARTVVYSFGEGTADGGLHDRNVLGGKGAGLAEMTLLGIPVPPGFTISTEVCNLYYQRRSEYPGSLRAQVEEALERLGARMNQRFGDPERPLLVSVRSGAVISMPGMMDTILNVGLNHETLAGLDRRAPSRRFGLDCYRRLIEMYGSVVAGLDHDHFAKVLADVKRGAGAQQDQDLGVEHLEQVVARYLAAYRAGSGRDFPQDPQEQLWGAIDAVFESWTAPRALTYRRIHHIPHDLGTAVNVQAMVFGNLGDRSATGVAFTRDPSSGQSVFYGEFLPNAQGEDVVAGIRTPQPMRKDEVSQLPSFEEQFPRAYAELLEVRKRLEAHYGDMQDIEFTVQEDRLFLLQTRRGKRTGVGALRIATDMVDERSIDERQALLQVEAASMEQLLAPAFRARDVAAAHHRLMTRGLAAGPGAASGRVALSAEQAIRMTRSGATAVILVRHETSPEDIAGMEVAAGIITARGGMTSHAAVVARGMGKPCVVGCEALHVGEGEIQAGGCVVKAGDYVSLDGSTGGIYVGELQTQPSEILTALEDPDEATDLSRRFERFMGWADQKRRLRVRANADTPEDARVARLLGAEGIGLCRTEHMFFGRDRILNFRRMIFAADAEERTIALEALLPYQRSDFEGIFREMDGLPVTIRLLDPPLHEFMPRTPGDIARFAEESGRSVAEVEEKLEQSREANPMLGLRGCRLGLTYPGIYEMQVRAIIEAALAVTAMGARPVPEVMIPLTSTHTETDELRRRLERVAEAVCEEHGAPASAVPYLFGTMIEIPRAALTADQLARHLDFFSFGTNDLTQMTFGLSRDDTAALLVEYVERGLYPHDPFVTLDQRGVGALIEFAVSKARGTKPGLKIGICGEHGGDPKSIAFCHRTGFDYVSCSPYRVPVARVAAAQAELSEGNA
ncbi:MAG: pyruvate, phosphate dikinase [Planctomycetota bacterium]